MEQTIQQRIADIQRGNVPAGYQRTKLGIIPADWETPELNSVLTENKERNRAGRFGKEDVLSVSGEFGVTNQIELLGRSFAGASVKDYHIVEAGNIVYTKSPLKENPYGIIKLNKGKAGIVSTLYAVYNCTTPATGLYLDYYFSLDQNVNNYLRPLVRKGTKNDMKINNEDVLKGCVILPPESETAKIVEILGYCDRVIALKKELIAEKKKQKKSLMQKLLNPDSGFRLPGFSGEWKEFVLNELGETYSGLAGKTAKDFECGNSFFVPYLNIFENTIVDVNKLEQVDIKPHENQNLVRYGDIFFTTSSETPEEVGMSSVFLADVNNTYLNSFCFGFRLYGFEKLLPFFAAYYLRSDYMRTILNNLAQGATRFNISKTLLMKSKIKIPASTVEQQAIADILSAADKEIDLLEHELAQQEQKKKSLMQLLLTGIVRV